jgi:hypothetical protein
MGKKTKTLETTFLAILHKITTTIDGGINITLSISQKDTEEIKKMFLMRGRLLSCALVSKKEKYNSSYNLEENNDIDI